MISIDNISVLNIENAIRGMRNPLDSWDRSDSKFCYDIGLKCEACSLNDVCNNHILDIKFPRIVLGSNDKELALKLIKAGSDHAKFLRQIFVSMDINAPLYWWKEMDTYKIGTTTNSCSIMHTIHKKPFSIDMFSVDEENIDLIEFYNAILIPQLEQYRKLYLETGDKKYWRMLIQLLPTSFNQLRTWTGSYANLRNMYHSRKNHKLIEWREFCTTLEMLPYREFIAVT
ncbi:MAG: hypothetical protein QXD03_05155 [Candidatus Anstonellales archaeon]